MCNLNMKWILCFVNLVFVHAGVINNDLFKLDIIHYNDFHARFVETSVTYPVCTANDSSCLGGIARLYQEIQTLLKEKPGALVLNAGDTFQGTFWYTLLKWNVTQQFINLLPNDAHAIGNHEFDDGVSGLAPYLAAMKAPVVAANLNTTLEPTLEGLYKPHVILEKKGRRIGIIGLVTTETKMSSNSGNAIFNDPIEAAEREAQILTEKGVDIIIVLSHCGIEVDKKMARTVGENIDIIVGGHSHSLLWNGTAPSGEHVSGPYPILVETEHNTEHKVLIVTAACFSKYLGNITTYFDREGNLKGFDGQPVFLNRSIPEDPEVKALLQPYADKLYSLLNEEVGYTTRDLIADTCASKECAIGDMIADAFVDATKQMNVSSLPHTSFLLRNMIRGSIPQGVIRKSDLINTMPFTNNVTTFSLPGKYLIEAFKLCTTNFWVWKPFQGPWVPQVSGLRLTLNLTDDPTVEVLIKDGDEFHNLDPNKEYQVTTINFIARGGNKFDMLHKYGKNKVFVGKDTEILEKYMKRLSPITPVVDNRLTIIN
ncbi:apyrase-like [Aricia agestis]|uniref:apyrase-like n=1 Tax=Aricia agestis TaxID=91739 RepID=UPI001C207DBD|nr:apyrase-like [Aricia agestis]